MTPHAFATVCLRLLGVYFLVSSLPLVLALLFSFGSHSAVAAGGTFLPWPGLPLIMYWPPICGVFLLVFSRSFARLLCRGLDPVA